MAIQMHSYDRELLRQASRELLESRASHELLAVCEQHWGRVEPAPAPPAPAAPLPAAPPPPSELVREVHETRVEKVPRVLLAAGMAAALLLAGLAAVQIVLQLRKKTSGTSSEEFVKEHIQQSRSAHDRLDLAVGQVDEKTRQAQETVVTLDDRTAKGFHSVEGNLEGIRQEMKALSGRKLMNDEQIRYLALRLEFERVTQDLAVAERRYTGKHPRFIRLEGRVKELRRQLGIPSKSRGSGTTPPPPTPKAPAASNG